MPFRCHQWPSNSFKVPQWNPWSQRTRNKIYPILLILIIILIHATRLVDLKNNKHLIFYLWQIFYDVLKQLIFCMFRNFENHQLHIQKIIVCVLSNETMLDQTQYRLISPFSNDNFFKTGVHFRFKRETLKVI